MGLFSTKSLALSDFESFSTASDFCEEAMIGRPLLGRSRFKAISSLSFQRYSGETASIVEDFKKGLAQKYGEEIAGFVFSQDKKQTVLSHGLTKKTIAAVLKKASTLKEAHFFSYRQELETKEKVAIQVVEKLKETACYAEAEEKYQELQSYIKDFNNTLTCFESELNLSDKKLEMLQSYFKEKLSDVDVLARKIQDLSDFTNISVPKSKLSKDDFSDSLKAKEKIEKIFGNSELSKQVFKVFLQHNAVMEELKEEVNGTWRSSTPEAVTTTISNTLDPLVRTIEKAGALLSSFSAHFNEANSLNYFSLNQRGEVILQEKKEKSPSVQRAQERAAQVFFDGLKECYGVDFINQLRSKEIQNHPLIVEEAVELLKKIHESFTRLGDFLKKQPFLFTKEYLDELHSHPHLVTQTKKDYEELEAPERSLLQSIRYGVKTGILITGHHISSSSYAYMLELHFGTLGAASGALVVAALIGAAAGLAVIDTSDHEQVQVQAAGISAILTAEGVLGEIAAKIIFSPLPEVAITWGSWMKEIITSWTIAGGIGYGVNANAIVNATRNAFVGGSVSGALAAREEVQDTTDSTNTTLSPGTEVCRGQINVASELSLEERLGMNYVWNIAMDNLNKLIDAISRIPIDEASVAILPSRRINL